MRDISQGDLETEWILVPHDRNTTASESEEIKHQIEHIEKELLSLKLQKRRLQERVQSLRQAISTLVGIFGAAILDGDNQPLRISQNHRSRREELIDLCTAVLQETLQWLSIAEILALLQSRSPEIVSSLQKPGVSISHVLRVLHRRGKVTCLYARPEPKWQWVPAASPQISSDITAQH